MIFHNEEKRSTLRFFDWKFGKRNANACKFQEELGLILDFVFFFYFNNQISGNKAHMRQLAKYLFWHTKERKRKKPSDFWDVHTNRKKGKSEQLFFDWFSNFRIWTVKNTFSRPNGSMSNKHITLLPKTISIEIDVLAVLGSTLCAAQIPFHLMSLIRWGALRKWRHEWVHSKPNSRRHEPNEMKSYCCGRN